MDSNTLFKIADSVIDTTLVSIAKLVKMIVEHDVRISALAGVLNVDDARLEVSPGYEYLVAINPSLDEEELDYYWLAFRSLDGKPLSGYVALVMEMCKGQWGPRS